ncbi:uncharacterized protein [Mobula birostris]|uniref:uncharacterized protein n=1 Tax=Mobula birostris TaxID=1983395 RepID=UPI003B27BE9A
MEEGPMNFDTADSLMALSVDVACELMDFSTFVTSPVTLPRAVCSTPLHLVIPTAQTIFGPEMTDAASVHAVLLKLSSFWTLRPHLWFEQAEAQFHIRQITSESTRYYYVLSSLDQETAAQVEEFIQSPPEDGKYTAFKALLIRTSGLSRHKRARRLMLLDGLGDRPPSALMNEMLALAEGHKPCLMFEQAFLEQLPEDICLLLSDADFSDPREVVARAGVLWNARKERGASVAQITKPRAQRQTRPGPAAEPTKPGDGSEELLLPAVGHRGPPLQTTLQIPGKRQGSLLYVWDKQSGRCFLVDTRAEISVLPPTSYDTRNREPGPTLRAANGSTIRTYGTRTVQLQFSSSRFTWDFTLAAVANHSWGRIFYEPTACWSTCKGSD